MRALKKKVIRELRNRLLALAWTRALLAPWMVRRKFRRICGKALDLKNPRTFSEKLNWMKLHGGLERLGPLVDKAAVRGPVAAVIGAERLTPVIGIYASAAEIDWERLPRRFVIKATHGSGWNVVVQDKAQEDWPALQVRLGRWLKTNYYSGSQEAQYLNVPPRLVVEEHIGLEGADLKDFKVFCFGGEPFMVQVDAERYTAHTRDFYEAATWTRLDVRCTCEPLKQPEPRPAELDELLGLARRLAAGFPFVRVDFYIVKGRIYFGELTFTPSAGLAKFEPAEFDLKLGGLLQWPAGGLAGSGLQK